MTDVIALTGVVPTGNVFEYVAPSGTSTEAGTAAVAGFELLSIMITPPVGAGPFSQTLLYIDVEPPVSTVEDKRTDSMATGCTVMDATFATPRRDAVMLTVVGTNTLLDATGKDA
jgi:hypothetical protein